MSSHAHTVCTATGKRGYGSRHLAIAVHRSTGNRVRAYQCPDCHRWHVTHETYDRLARSGRG